VYIDYVARLGDVSNALILSSGWTRDTRDDILYPSKGRLQSAILEIGVPPGDLTYYKANYLHQWFLPVYSDFVLMLRADTGYGAGYDYKPLPFFKAFYAGGVGSVRAYETSSLGPRDIYGNITGGRLKMVGNVELFYPIIKGDKSVRASVFTDAGEIWYNGKQPQYESFRYSAGVGLAWNSPLGPLKFSYGVPLHEKSGDRIQRFQFQVGSVF
jgi:outer membrane protein insertion porin family